jgi:hypothetical protein
MKRLNFLSLPFVLVEKAPLPSAEQILKVFTMGLDLAPGRTLSVSALSNIFFQHFDMKWKKFSKRCPGVEDLQTYLKGLSNFELYMHNDTLYVRQAESQIPNSTPQFEPTRSRTAQTQVPQVLRGKLGVSVPSVVAAVPSRDVPYSNFPIQVDRPAKITAAKPTNPVNKTIRIPPSISAEELAIAAQEGWSQSDIEAQAYAWNYLKAQAQAEKEKADGKARVEQALAQSREKALLFQRAKAKAEASAQVSQADRVALRSMQRNQPPLAITSVRAGPEVPWAAPHASGQWGGSTKVADNKLAQQPLHQGNVGESDQELIAAAQAARAKAKMAHAQNVAKLEAERRAAEEIELQKQAIGRQRQQLEQKQLEERGKCALLEKQQQVQAEEIRQRQALTEAARQKQAQSMETQRKAQQQIQAEEIRQRQALTEAARQKQAEAMETQRKAQAKELEKREREAAQNSQWKNVQSRRSKKASRKGVNAQSINNHAAGQSSASRKTAAQAGDRYPASVNPNLPRVLQPSLASPAPNSSADFVRVVEAQNVHLQEAFAAKQMIEQSRAAQAAEREREAAEKQRMQEEDQESRLEEQLLAEQFENEKQAELFRRMQEEDEESRLEQQLLAERFENETQAELFREQEENKQLQFEREQLELERKERELRVQQLEKLLREQAARERELLRERAAPADELLMVDPEMEALKLQLLRVKEENELIRKNLLEKQILQTNLIALPLDATHVPAPTPAVSAWAAMQVVVAVVVVYSSSIYDHFHDNI